MKYTPSRFPTNPGVSLHSITLFPRLKSAKDVKRCNVFSETSFEVTTSSKGRYRGGLKKWLIRNLEAISGDMPSTSSARGSVEVFDETMVSGPMCSAMLA